jgi:hypothetical protein
MAAVQRVLELGAADVVVAAAAEPHFVEAVADEIVVVVAVLVLAAPRQLVESSWLKRRDSVWSVGTA